METGDKIVAGAAVTLVGSIAALVMSLSGTFGSRGLKTDYSFNYKNEPAKVIREDIRWGPDNYWIQQGKSRIKDGKLITDDNKIVKINRNYFDVKGYIGQKE